MAKQSEEAKLRRRAVGNRRGVFSTWGYPTWDAFLVRADRGDDPADAIAACGGVGAVVRDVTAEVLGGTWQPPLGEWALLVIPEATPWSHLVSGLRGDEMRERLGDRFRGETLQTGYQDTAGVIYVRCHAGGAERLNFVTDGARWDRDTDGDDDEGITRLSGDMLGPDWLEGVSSTPDAHQEILRGLDAYVPGLTVDGGSLATIGTHGDFVSAEHIKRIDLVRFGEVPKDEPSPEVTAAGRRLHEAVEKSDLEGVKAALVAGATLGLLPDGRPPALWTACYHLGKGRADTEAIVDLLLEAGADPNLYSPGGGAGHLLFHLVANDRHRLDATHRVIRKTVAVGADPDPRSTSGPTPGERPLHRAAKRARADLVRVLLEVGADPAARDGEGHTPREAVAHLLEGKARYMTAEELKAEREDYAEVLALLEAAEIG